MSSSSCLPISNSSFKTWLKDLPLCEVPCVFPEGYYSLCSSLWGHLGLDACQPWGFCYFYYLYFSLFLAKLWTHVILPCPHENERSFVLGGIRGKTWFSGVKRSSFPPVCLPHQLSQDWTWRSRDPSPLFANRVKTSNRCGMAQWLSVGFSPLRHNPCSTIYLVLWSYLRYLTLCVSVSFSVKWR